VKVADRGGQAPSLSGSPPSAPAASSAGAQDGRPRLAEGIELIGEYKGSGFKEPPYLARRGDGQVIQLPRLLYLVAEQADGQHDMDQIASVAGENFGRPLNADNVRFLVEKKLRPLGVLAAADGSSPKLKKANPLLALNFKAALVPQGLVRTVTAVFLPLFWPLFVIAVLAGFAALDVWLFAIHGVAQSFRNLFNEPVFFVFIFGLVVISAAFHEIGHATGCRYGGAKPGVMGAGLYLVWPAFYTDVTDAYRLGKGGRLRTDLGGVYFNSIFLLATVGLYLLTQVEALLVVVLALQFEMLHQFLPFLRLDGYYVISDLTGVPDIFTRIKPTLLSLLPGRKPDQRVTELKTWVRAVVTLWVFATAAFILYAYGMMILHLPRIVGTAIASFLHLLQSTIAAFAHGHLGTGAFGSVQLLLLALPTLGLALVLFGLGRRLLVGGWKATRGRPVGRMAYLITAAIIAALLILAWWPRQHPPNYRPIQPNEKGTVAESFRSIPVAGVLSGLGVSLPWTTTSPTPTATPGTSPSPGTTAPAASPATSSQATPQASVTPSATPSASP
jgi:putative peptide zinc metalloprotease protein